jgi:hypothetical protein
MLPYTAERCPWESADYVRGICISVLWTCPEAIRDLYNDPMRATSADIILCKNTVNLKCQSKNTMKITTVSKKDNLTTTVILQNDNPELQVRMLD